ncbi:hypothetical protein KUTeg_020033 [Tegillarca granosa]|uniref:Phosphatidylinositol-3-phosphatase SAC1 n=1 Tax=Tegillarca granosa TaxID=220873 RepID=A0ABQ9EEA7_TEGGR|nr:hypothetical protein KUTeg_020033 [Tegillarca granosa]
MSVYESLHLHITSDKFYLVPRDVTDSNEILVIDRVTQEISLQKIHSYKRTLYHLTERQTLDNKTYLLMLENALKAEHYYFSSTYDITHTLQRLYNTSPDFVQMSLHERADQRFLWNGHVLKELSQQPELILTIKPCSINSKTFEYILVSRRSVYRAGTRFYVRGIDTEGQVANFVETEQIIQCDGHMGSYVQIRGSIPIYWSQRPNLKYKPHIKINTSGHMEVFNRHMEDQSYNYGDQVIVNLVNQTGSEGLLEKSFSQCITNSQNQNVRYEYFDFHHECKRMRWDRLSILVNRLAEDTKRFGCFMLQKDGTVVSHQNGIFRTNCIDCLDRTNVVQSLFARVIAEEQLKRLGVLEGGQSVADYGSFNNLFNNIWADNADIISKQYAGTGALKTDFTRLGKRTNFGLLMDGWNSLIRYFKNNFSDGFRQDSIDLILGNYEVEENEGISKQCPLQMPVIFVIAIAMSVISILLPDENVTEQFMYVLFWGSASVVSMAMIYIFGVEFVDKPKLVHTSDKAL